MKIKRLFFSALFLVFFCSVPSFNIAFATNSPPVGEASPDVASNNETPSQHRKRATKSAPPSTSPPTLSPSHHDEPRIVEVPEPSSPPVQAQAPVVNSEPAKNNAEIKKLPPKEELPPESIKPTQEEKKEEKEPEKVDSAKAPVDLPDVESDEILFPEVISSPDTAFQRPKNLLAGIIAWTCIALGIAIVIFVLIKGRHRGEIEPKNIKVHNAPHKKKGKRLLDDKYYKK